MKHFDIVIVLLLFSFGCSPTPKDENTLVDTDLIKTQEEQPVETPLTNHVISGLPCDELLDFVAQIEKNSWIPDTLRLSKVGIYRELNNQNITYFNGRPFYHIPFDNNRLSYIYNTFTAEHLKELDYALFSKVNKIWGYFYRNKDATEWISDGVIEQWEFETEETASKALKEITSVSDIVYFNTQPYFCRIDNKLIIFQTRAMKFSYDQKPLFEQFIKESKAITPN